MNSKVPLGEVAKFINGRAFKPSDWGSNGLPIIRIQNLTNEDATFNYYDKAVEEQYYVKDGDLLISWSATLDVFIWNRGNAVLNQHIFKAIPDTNKISKMFLFYALKYVMDELRAQTHGATMKHITRKPFEQTKIFLPPLPEQERIVRLLDEAEFLRATRERANVRMEQFVPALFQEMFGDPNENKNSWQTFKLKDLIVEGDKVNYGVVQPGDDFPRGIPIVRVGDFNNMQISLENIKRIDPAIEENYKRSRLYGDEILIACVGSIGLIALADVRLKNFNIVRAVARVRPSDKLDRLFLASYFTTSFAQDYFKNSTRTVTQPTLNIKQIEETIVPVPPLALQREFAARVEEARGVQSAQARSAGRVEALYQSMLSRAFAGEL